MSEKRAPAKVAEQVVARGVFLKLIIFSIALGVAPLGSYYGSLNSIWGGNSTYAAITAVGAANAVLIAYIITSLLEDQGTSQPIQPAGESRKNR
ncbi:hypothetical protein BDN72DRAFT_954551 [Pluteus cervinus]|uniref:Uncharacterized protein n=1 Tax=Pluteus cervinus TaxID=181527 RepID=A0ACD3BDC9_9AGAR|nr:hypothetical protein BDN72DRAFT_954551 [Pluteus cervinus]